MAKSRPCLNVRFPVLNLVKPQRRKAPRFIYSFAHHQKKMVYVGLTSNVRRRFSEHLRDHEKLIELHKLGGLEFEVSDVSYPEKIAKLKEDEKLNEWLNKGYTKLNIMPTGSLGSDVRKWDKPACMVEARKFKTRTTWAKGSPGSYEVARLNGWIKECCVHMPRFARSTKPGAYLPKERAPVDLRKEALALYEGLKCFGLVSITFEKFFKQMQKEEKERVAKALASPYCYRP